MCDYGLYICVAKGCKYVWLWAVSMCLRAIHMCDYGLYICVAKGCKYVWLWAVCV